MMKIWQKRRLSYFKTLKKESAAQRYKYFATANLVEGRSTA
jgi:hypothetical protein